MRPLVAVVLGLVAACGLRTTFACADDAACGAGGTCQPEGWCSFPDDTCPSGQRFGEHSGDGLGNACVDASDTGGSEPGDDDGVLESVGEVTQGEGSTAGPSDTGSTMPLEDSGNVETTTDDGGMPETGGSETTGVSMEPPPPIAWYSFEDAAAPFTDVSGNGHHGFCSEQFFECPSPAAGVVGLAAEFDGLAHHGHVEDAPWLATTTALSVAAWVDPVAVAGSHQAIAAKPLGSIEGDSWDLALSDGLPRFEASIESSSTAALAVGDYPDDGDWHHVAFVWDGALLRLYLDGIEVGSTRTSEIEFDTHSLSIGADVNYDADYGFYGGLMDELRIYDVALSAAEVAVLATR